MLLPIRCRVGTVAAFPSEHLGPALTTFLLKVFAPATFALDRPVRGSSRKAKKSGGFPARKPSVTNVLRPLGR